LEVAILTGPTYAIIYSVLGRMGIEHEIPVERVQEFDVFIIRPGEGLLQPIKSPNSTK
jgi:hypothetical protein